MNVIISGEVRLGQSFEIKGEVRNRGEVKVTNVEIMVYLEGKVLKKVSLGEISPSEREEFTIEVTIPSDIALGPHNLILLLTGTPALRSEFRREIMVRASLKGILEEKRGRARELIDNARAVLGMLKELAVAEEIPEISELVGGAELDYEEALVLYEQGRYEEADEKFDEALKSRIGHRSG